MIFIEKDPHSELFYMQIRRKESECGCFSLFFLKIALFMTRNRVIFLNSFDFHPDIRRIALFYYKNRANAKNL